MFHFSLQYMLWASKRNKLFTAYKKSCIFINNFTPQVIVIFRKSFYTKITIYFAFCCRFYIDVSLLPPLSSTSLTPVVGAAGACQQPLTLHSTPLFLSNLAYPPYGYRRQHYSVFCLNVEMLPGCRGVPTTPLKVMADMVRILDFLQ